MCAVENCLHRDNYDSGERGDTVMLYDEIGHADFTNL